MWTLLIPLLVFSGWVAVIVRFAALHRRKTVEWNGHRVFTGFPDLRPGRSRGILEVGVDYVANYVVDIRRSYPDPLWRDWNLFGEISLDGIEGGKDFRAFGTAPAIARMLVADPFVRAAMQRQFSDPHDSLFIDAEGVRVRRVFGDPRNPGLMVLFTDTRALVAEARPLAVAAYELVRSAPAL